MKAVQNNSNKTIKTNKTRYLKKVKKILLYTMSSEIIGWQ